MNETYPTEQATLTGTVLIITIALAVIGWFISLYLQEKALKEQHKTQIKYDIYKQLIKNKNRLIKSLNTLGTIPTPLILMSASMIPFDLKIKKEVNGIWIERTEHECLFEGKKIWMKYTSELSQAYYDFSYKFINFITILEDWETALKKLNPSTQIFRNEVYTIQQKIHKNIEILQSFSQNHAEDWRTWDNESINKTSREISDDCLRILFYIHDFMVLSQNELLSPYFGIYKKTRATIDPKYKVLTNEGLSTRLDKRSIKQIEKNNKIFLKKIKEYQAPSSDGEREIIESLKINICPECHQRIIVIAINGEVFKFLCGHEWKTDPE